MAQPTTQRASASQLRQLGAAELEKQAAQARQHLWSLQAKRRAGTLQQLHEFRQTRRHLARLLTILNEESASASRQRSAA